MKENFYGLPPRPSLVSDGSVGKLQKEIDLLRM